MRFLVEAQVPRAGRAVLQLQAAVLSSWFPSRLEAGVLNTERHWPPVYTHWKQTDPHHAAHSETTHNYTTAKEEM